MNSPGLDQSNPHTSRCDYLMVLRGLSALTVVFCHFPFELHKLIPSEPLALVVKKYLDWVLDPFGYIPVLIFFSLSGYLITLGFHSGRHVPTTLAGLKTYYRSRILRIIPLYYFSIFLCVLLYWSAASQSPLRVVQLFAFIENYKPVQGIIFNHVYWTMPVEMLYFLFAPLIFVALDYLMKRLKDWTVLFALGIAFICIALIVFYALPVVGVAYIVDRKSWSLIARFDFFYNLMAFVLGGACVFIVKNERYLKFFYRNRLIIKVVSCLFLCAVTAYCSTRGLSQLDAGRLSYFIAFGLIPSIALFVLGVAILNETQQGRIKPYSKVLVHLGLLAYAIYLFHMPALHFVEMLVSRFNVSISNEVLSLSSLIVTLLFSQLAYQYIERPFLLRRAGIDGKVKSSKITQTIY